MDAKMRAYLEAIGYRVEPGYKGTFWPYLSLSGGWPYADFDCESEDGAWVEALRHSRSPDGMVATHSAKEAWLCSNYPGFDLSFRNGLFQAWLQIREERARPHASGDSPQAAVDALCHKVLGGLE